MNTPFNVWLFTIVLVGWLIYYLIYIINKDDDDDE